MQFMLHEATQPLSTIIALLADEIRKNRNISAI